MGPPVGATHNRLARGWRRLRGWFSSVVGVWAAPLILFALRLSGRRAGLVLLYHPIQPAGGRRERELAPAVSCAEFGWQLKHLKHHYDIVPAEKLLAATAARRRGQRFPASLTFDDDLRQHLEYTAPMLNAEHVPATFFLSGTSLDEPRSTWWERVQRAVDCGNAPAELVELLPTASAAELDGREMDIHRLAGAIEKLEPDQRDVVAEHLLAPAGPDPADAGLSAAEITSLVGSRDIRVGFHTLRHDPLTGLGAEGIDRAMKEGRDRLAALCGHPLEVIAYPHGYADAKVADAARAAGFRIGFMARRCAVTPSSDPLLLGRCDAVSIGGSPGGFALGAVRTLMIKDTKRERR